MRCCTGRGARSVAAAPATADGRFCAWYYIRQGTFIVDFISFLPFILQIILLAAGYEGSLLRIFYMLRLLRLLRCGRPPGPRWKRVPQGAALTRCVLSDTG